MELPYDSSCPPPVGWMVHRSVKIPKSFPCSYWFTSSFLGKCQIMTLQKIGNPYAKMYVKGEEEFKWYNWHLYSQQFSSLNFLSFTFHVFCIVELCVFSRLIFVCSSLKVINKAAQAFCKKISVCVCTKKSLVFLRILFLQAFLIVQSFNSFRKLAAGVQDFWQVSIESITFLVHKITSHCHLT